jgi:hypothetical protein
MTAEMNVARRALRRSPAGSSRVLAGESSCELAINQLWKNTRIPLDFITIQTQSSWKRACSLLLTGAATVALAADDPKKPPPSPAGSEAAEVAQALRESWPDHPDWVDMLTSILEDAPMGPNFGWFRTAVSQTRFDWESTRNRLDRNRDGWIAREEFPGDDHDFARLDRNRDGRLTPPDFDFSGSSLAPSPGAIVFARLDRNGNGKVTREELDTFFRSADSAGQGFLSLSDLQEAFAPPPTPSPGSGRPSKATLVRGLFLGELGSLEPGPKLGESAPDFALSTHDRRGIVRLSEYRGAKPVVLIFGSFT